MIDVYQDARRRLISENTKQALDAKRKAGMKLGRPPGHGRLDAYREEIVALLANGSSPRFISERYGTAPGNVRRWMKQHHLGRYSNST